ncbi:MAG: hypothetical protein EKK48_31070 [Candidatus Melainabacteria bacterium]|nr:MAG: hypothetical protein EKK48_31070 [Candidatus Melainabacteria bacterium]
MKPYGVDSERRERLAVSETFADYIRQHKQSTAKIGVLPLSTSFRGLDASQWLENIPVEPSKPVVKIKAYAHDRVTLHAYLKPPVYRVRSMRRKTLAQLALGTSALVKPSEFRRHYKIGNRLVFQPSPTSFTSYARNYCMDAAHVVETYAKGRGVFVTLTLPGNTPEVFRCFSAATGYVVDRMNRWLRYKVVNSLFMYVFEFQKRGALHMHYLFRLPDGVKNREFTRDLRAQWRKILLDVSEESSVDLFRKKDGGTWRHRADKPRIQVKNLRGTYAQYISKYASKAESKSGVFDQFSPRRWWGCSREARVLVSQSRLEQVLPVNSVSDGFQGMLSLLMNLGDFALSHKFYGGFPGEETDCLSVMVPVGTAKLLANSFVDYVSHGDLLPLQCALVSLSESNKAPP